MAGNRKTDRTLHIRSWSGGPIILVLIGFHSVTAGELQSQIEYRFNKGSDILFSLDSTKVKITKIQNAAGPNLQMFEITGLKAKKKINREAVKDLERSQLTHSSSNTSISSERGRVPSRKKKTQKSTLDLFGATQPRVILKYQGHEIESNLIKAEKPDCYTLSNMHYVSLLPDGNSDGNNLYQIRVSGRISQFVVCTLSSCHKWLEISLSTHGTLSPIYYFVTKNYLMSDRLYYQIRSADFSICFQVCRLTWEEMKQNNALREKLTAYCSITDDIDDRSFDDKLKHYLTDQEYNHFKVQVRLVHSEDPQNSHNSNSMESYAEVSPEISDKFTDNCKDLFGDRLPPMTPLNADSVIPK